MLDQELLSRNRMKDNVRSNRVYHQQELDRISAFSHECDV
jgi:hypothetical protein